MTRFDVVYKYIYIVTCRHVVLCSMNMATCVPRLQSTWSQVCRLSTEVSACQSRIGQNWTTRTRFYFLCSFALNRNIHDTDVQVHDSIIHTAYCIQLWCHVCGLACAMADYTVRSHPRTHNLHRVTSDTPQVGCKQHNQF